MTLILRRRFIQILKPSRCFNTGKLNYSSNNKPESFSTKPDPNEVTHDYIGPPDKESNLRTIVRCIPPNETPLAKRLREQRIEVEQWNQDFWSRHNKRFYEEKEDFINLYKTKGIDIISADKMSEFYKRFLDKNWKIHFYYNISWYLKNFDLLILASQVNIQTFWNKMKKK